MRISGETRAGTPSKNAQQACNRGAMYIFYGKLSVYLKALERDAGEQWAMRVG
ncbi:MAG: hypothetical protein M3395_07685 [Chloroflexota bacterium]|nr:hypothetical protein [Chloroflexota bacterium]